MPPDPYIFATAEESRDKIMRLGREQIKDFYLNCANEIGRFAKQFEGKDNISAVLQAEYYRELERQVIALADEVSKNLENSISKNAYLMGDAIANANRDWLKNYGIAGAGVSGALSSITNAAVLSVLSGAIYKDGQGLSPRIWRDLQQTQHDIYTILAQAQAEQMGVYDASKMLVQYVNPTRRKNWNLRMTDGRYIYKSRIDYNAQRLARTITQHSYQKGLVDSTAKNPFVYGFIWRANGSRPCPLCEDRDGQFYGKDDLPLDHPQGMCTFEPSTAPDDTITSALAAWVAGDKGDYPALDSFAESLGYED